MTTHTHGGREGGRQASVLIIMRTNRSTECTWRCHSLPETRRTQERVPGFKAVVVLRRMYLSLHFRTIIARSIAVQGQQLYSK